MYPNQLRAFMLQVTETPLQTDLNNKGDVSSHLNGNSSRTPCLLLVLPAVKDNSFIPTWSSPGPGRLVNHNPGGECASAQHSTQESWVHLDCASSGQIRDGKYWLAWANPQKAACFPDALWGNMDK